MWFVPCIYKNKKNYCMISLKYLFLNKYCIFRISYIDTYVNVFVGLNKIIFLKE